MPNIYTDKHNNELKLIRNIFKKNLGFDYVSDINIPTGKGGGDIDLVCYDSETLFYIELKNGTTAIQDQFANFLMKRNSDLHFLKNNFQKTKTKNILDVKYFFFVPRITVANEKKLNEILSQQPNQEKIFILRNLNEFEELSKQVDKIYAKREFFWQYNVNLPKQQELCVDAICSSLAKRGEMYQFTCLAKDLIKFASVPRRTEDKKKLSNYQRLVSGSRLTKIAENHIDKGGDFVNNVILKLDKEQIQFSPYEIFFKENSINNSRNKNAPTEDVSVGLLKIKMDFNSAFIIDGQHRLLSYYKSNKNGLIRVSGLVNIRPEQEAKYFIDINDNATKVKADLIWDLTADLSPRTDKGIISRIFKELHLKENVIFFQSLSIPSMSGKNKNISFSGLCRTLEDDCTFEHKEKWPNFNAKLETNPFYNKEYEVETSAKLISSFFDTVFKDFDSKKKNLFFNNAVISVYMQLCFDYYRSFGKKGNEEALKHLNKIVNDIDDEEIEERRKLSDSDGKKYHKEKILQELQVEFKKFGKTVVETTFEQDIIKFEGELRTWTYNKIMNFEKNNDWFNNKFQNQLSKWNRENKFEYTKERSKHDFLQFGQVTELIVNKNGQNYWEKIFEEIFMQYEFHDVNNVEKALNNIYKKRNPKEHGSKEITSRFDFNPAKYKMAKRDLKIFRKIIDSN